MGTAGGCHGILLQCLEVFALYLDPYRKWPPVAGHFITTTPRLTVRKDPPQRDDCAVMAAQSYSLPLGPSIRFPTRSRCIGKSDAERVGALRRVDHCPACRVQPAGRAQSRAARQLRRAGAARPQPLCAAGQRRGPSRPAITSEQLARATAGNPARVLVATHRRRTDARIPKEGRHLVREVEHELADTNRRIEELRDKREAALLADDTNALDAIELTMSRLQRAARRQQERLRLLAGSRSRRTRPRRCQAQAGIARALRQEAGGGRCRRGRIAGDGRARGRALSQDHRYQGNRPSRVADFATRTITLPPVRSKARHYQAVR